MMRRLIQGALLATPLLLFGGCGRETDPRVAVLEREIAKLRKELAGSKSSADKAEIAALGNRIAELEKKLGVKAPDPAPTETKVTTYHSDWKAVPLDEAAKKGLDWLASVQAEDGGWGQDGGHEGDARKGVNLESTGNDVANTALACLALLRSGTTPKEGPYRENLVRGVEFILAHVEDCPAEGIAITKKTNTQIQRKLGPHIDTFLANLVLAEVDGQIGDAALAKRVGAGVEKCIAKIEKNQLGDGSWNHGGGWAPIIGTSMASRGLYNAQQKGRQVDEEVLVKVEKYSSASFDAKDKKFKGDAAAGVELYAAAQALENNSRSAEGRVQYADMNDAAAEKLGEAGFVGGFGSMGGEEFVSYMNVSDSLLRVGGEKWKTWNGKIKEQLVKLQNQDGTWAGHHCITGRVACTSAAVMTLLAERGTARAG